MVATTPETDLSDEELATRIAWRGGSDQALRTARTSFEQLYERHARPLLAYLAALARCGDRDDLHQEVWRRAWHHLPGGFRGYRTDCCKNMLQGQYS